MFEGEISYQPFVPGERSTWPAWAGEILPRFKLSRDRHSDSDVTLTGLTQTWQRVCCGALSLKGQLAMVLNFWDNVIHEMCSCAIQSP